MALKLITSSIVLLFNAVLALILFFGLIVAMNGYHESDATYGIAAYLALAVLSCLLATTLAWLTVHILMKREFRPWMASTVSIAAFCMLGTGALMISMALAIGITEFARANL